MTWFGVINAFVLGFFVGSLLWDFAHPRKPQVPAGASAEGLEDSGEIHWHSDATVEPWKTWALFALGAMLMAAAAAIESPALRRSAPAESRPAQVYDEHRELVRRVEALPLQPYRVTTGLGICPTGSCVVALGDAGFLCSSNTGTP